MFPVIVIVLAQQAIALKWKFEGKGTVQQLETDTKLQGNVVLSARMPSMLSCSQYCLKTWGCTNGNFKNETGQCELLKFHYNVPEDKTMSHARGWVTFRLNRLTYHPAAKGQPRTWYFSCLHAFQQGARKNGVYFLYPWKRVYCDMKTDKGGWTTIQKRVSNSVSFQRNWTEYSEGFGNEAGSYWLGLEILHSMLQQHTFKIRFDLQLWSGERAYAVYSKFSIGSNAERYILHISGYSGNATDAMFYHDGMKFSTLDKDETGCPQKHGGGGWWFKSCFYASLNGIYYTPETVVLAKGIHWSSWRQNMHSLKMTEIKIREL